MEEVAIDGIPWRVYKNAPRSMRDVLGSTSVYGDKPFLVYDDERYTFGDHQRIVSGLAWRLVERHGVAKGDRVAIAMRNYPDWAFTFWAVQALGAVAVPLNAWWSGPELEYALTDSKAKLLVVDGERLQRLEESLPDLGLEGVIVSRHPKGPLHGAERWEDVRVDLDMSGPLPDVDVEPEDFATIMYTSGTTGAPKGALATHRNHCTNIMNTMFVGMLGRAMAGAGGHRCRVHRRVVSQWRCGARGRRRLCDVVDRLKDVVIRGGENVYPAEVEVQELVAGRLARFKLPAHVFFRTEPLPRTATGKVIKRDLREEFTSKTAS